MTTPQAEQATQDALATGRAILKFISRNDVGDTGGHQYGYYLPKHCYELFTPIPPQKGKSIKSDVRVVWGNGIVTDSAVTWYGVGKSEYRLTRFGKGFPYIDRDNVGSLLVIVPRSYELFHAYVLDFDEDIESIQAALGVSLIGGSVAVYERGLLVEPESENACIDRHLRAFVEAASDFPPPAAVSEAARHAIVNCIKALSKKTLDSRLMAVLETEYRLFKMVERKLCSPQVTKVFKDIDEFLGIAQTILQRRKARAGLSFENQVQSIFDGAGLSYTAQSKKIDGKPDFIFPSEDAYLDQSFPTEKLTCLALKTTCKDRWRQVLREASRVERKHLLTLQAGISVNQLKEMRDSNVALVVPKQLQKDYNVADSGVELMTFEEFVIRVNAA